MEWQEIQRVWLFGFKVRGLVREPAAIVFWQQDMKIAKTPHFQILFYHYWRWEADGLIGSAESFEECVAAAEDFVLGYKRKS